MSSCAWALMEAGLVKCSHGKASLKSLKPLKSKLSNSSVSIHSAVATTYVKRAYDALLLDTGGTLLQLAKPVEETYASIGRKYGLTASSSDIKQGFKRAFAAPWPEKLHYQYYANGDAWHLPDGAYEGLNNLKDAGVKVAVVSNFDTRLRKLLKDPNIIELFDALIISSEVGCEKPDPKIFEVTLDEVGVKAGKAAHVGDDLIADKQGASSIGIDCWLWGADVKTFSDIKNRILISGW